MFVGSSSANVQGGDDDLFAGMDQVAAPAPPPREELATDNVFGNSGSGGGTYQPQQFDSQGFFQGVSEETPPPAATATNVQHTSHLGAEKETHPTELELDVASEPSAPPADLEHTVNSQQSQNSNPPVESGNFFKLEFYQKFFNVNTSDVIERLRWALFLGTPRYMKKREERDVGNARPDLYGPLWVSTTLWVMMAVCDVLAEKLSRWHNNVTPAPTPMPDASDSSSNSGSSTGWEFDFQYVILTLAASYAYVVGVPVLMWCILRYKDVQQVSLTKLICLYGYSLTPMIVGAAVTILPFTTAKIIAITVSALYSLIGIVAQLRASTKEFSVQWRIGLFVFVTVCHAVATFLLFFEIIALGNAY